MATTQCKLSQRAFALIVALLAVVLSATLSANAFAVEGGSANGDQAAASSALAAASTSDLTIGVQDDGSGETVTYYDGSYTGSAWGYKSTIEVLVVIEGGKITSAEATSQKETNKYWKKACVLFETIVAAQSADVDVVSGATYSSNGIIEAVDEALEKASSPFASGSGTEDDPYLVMNATQLQNFASSVDEGESYAGEFVALGADVDLSGVESWNPIGTEGKATATTETVFAGTFDGAGHAVANMKIALEGLDAEANLGLFSTLQNSARVENLSLTGVDVDVVTSAVARAGGIAGDVVAGTSVDARAVIDSCSVEGSVDADTSGAALAFAGGVAGRVMNYTLVSNCWTDVAATAFSRGGSNSAYAGGILGMSGANVVVVNCATFGSAKAASPKSTNFGGLAGGMSAMFAGKMYNVAASGDQTIGNAGSSNQWVGMISGQITTSGMSKGDDGEYAYPEAGPLRGYAYYNSGAALTVETYDASTGEVSSSAQVATAASGTGSTYDKVFETQTGIVKGMGASDMGSDSFVSTMNGNLSEVTNLISAYSLGAIELNTWELVDGRVVPTGETWYDAALTFASGSGTEDDPYLVMNATQLQNFATSVDEGESYAGEFVALGADVDLSGVESWNPIGTEGKATATTETVFAGTFDGAGHAVANMKIALEGLDAEANLGLFSTLQGGAVVKNLQIEAVNISAKSSAVVHAGGIAGNTMNGSADSPTVVDCVSVDGEVVVDTSGAKLAYCGGVLGQAGQYAYVTNTWTDVAAEGYSRGGTNSAYVGGIVGMSGNNSAVVNCATFGSAKAASPKSTNFGGLAGGMSAMFAGKMYNVAASGDQTIGNAGSSNQWVGMISGQITTSGMSKGDDGEYAYPEAGPLRGYAYYNSGAALTVETYDASTGEVSSSAQVATAASGTGSTYDKVFETQTGIVKGMGASDMGGDSFAGVMNGNLHDVTALISAYEINGVSLNTWELVDGRVLPTGETYVEIPPDATIFAGGTGSEDDPFLVETKDQLCKFAVSLGERTDYSGYYVKQTEDIDLLGEEWTPVGDSEYAFNGVYDGGGHTIWSMSLGSTDEAAQLETGAIFVGMFSVLGEDAVVKNVKLDDVCFNVSYDSTVYVGGIAGFTNGEASGYEGAVIDSCSVKGTLGATVDAHNVFVGGFVGNQYKGAIINGFTDVAISVTTKSGAIAEGGGLVALNNRGLIANCYTLGDVWGSGSRENGNEGAASISSLVGVNAGNLANCYGDGGHEAAEFSTYVGAVSGWITGIGKSYACWYNGDASMTVDGQAVNPVEAVGTQVASGVSEDGLAYTGGLSDALTSYAAESYSGIVDGLNATFGAFPIDISVYGLPSDALKSWKYDADAKQVVLAEEASSTTYVQPEIEKVPVVEPVLLDGTWYGRSEDKTSVVAVTVENAEVKSTEVVSGENSGEAYEEALALAEEKAIYGDTTDYSAPDAANFAGGSGTESDPYQIANEDQLRYIAESLNDDNSWEGVYFKQTGDIALSGEEWLPIGWGIKAEVNHAGTQYCLYPFCGNYDGGDFTISGLTIGSDEGASQDPRASFTAGFFGITAGDATYNDTPQEGDRTVSVKNVHLVDVNINVASRYDNYVGGLAGNMQNGFYVDNCSVEGSVKASSEESHARAGGLMGNALRGCVTDSWTNATAYASKGTGMGGVYVGGFYGMDNRVTTVNSYSLGDVSGNAGNNNRVYAGGFVGQAGGCLCNCYTAGDVVSEKTTAFAGALSGNFAGIAIARNCYYNTNMKLEVAGSAVDPVVVNGKTIPTNEKALAVYGKTAAEIASADFATELNSNRELVPDEMAVMAEIVGVEAELSAMVYYSGDGSDLMHWALVDNVVVLDEAAWAQDVDKAAAAAAESAINEAIPDANAADSESVKKAEEALAALTDAQKALVSDEAKDKVAAAQAAAAINEIGENATTASKDAIDKAQAAYDALTDAQKALITSAAKRLANAQSTYAAAAAAKAADEAAKKVTDVTVNVKTVNSKVVADAIAAAGGKAEYVTTITLGKKVKKISKKAFANCPKVIKLVVKSKKLKKKSVKGSLKGSKVKLVKVQIGKKKVNKKFVKKYKKIFKKKIAGKKVKVKK